MQEIFDEWKANAKAKDEENFMFIRSMKFKSEKRVDKLAKALHEKAFEKIDCLKCGNCCRTMGPVWSEKDISKIGKHLELKPKQVKEEYLKKDEDNDWVLNSLPCPFLNQENNECTVYESRPKDCREFPHTQKSGFATRTYGHSQHTLVCPAVYYIVEEMKKNFRY